MRRLAQLAQLETKGILRLATVDVQTEYEFKHSLLQEMAYRSLLMEERKQLHGLIGKVLEETHADQLEEQAARLAHHFSQSGLPQKALKYSRLAGSESLRLHAYGEAVSHYEAALNWARSESIPRAEFQQAYLDLGRSLELAAQFKRALKLYEDMRDYAVSIADRKMELAALIAQSTLYSTSSPFMDREKGAELSRRALEGARDIGEVGLEIQARWNLVLALGFQIGQEVEALDHGEAGLQLAEQHDEEELKTLLRNDLGRIHVFCGNLVLGEKMVHEALKSWRARENSPMIVDCLKTLSLLSLMAGKFDEYPTINAEAQVLADEIGNDWARAYSLIMSDRYYFVIGEFGQALDSAYEALKRGGKINFIAGLAMSNIILGAIYFELGKADEAMAYAERALTTLGGAYHPFADEARAVQAMVHIRRGELALAEEILAATRLGIEEDSSGRCLSLALVPIKLAKAEVNLAEGQLDRCYRDLQQLENQLNARGIRLYLPELLSLQGRVLMLMDKPDLAFKNLQKGLELASNLGANRDVWYLHAAMAEVQGRLGNNSAAAQHWRQAAAVVDELAGSLSEYPDLQESFYAKPAVTKVREASP